MIFSVTAACSQRNDFFVNGRLKNFSPKHPPSLLLPQPRTRPTRLVARQKKSRRVGAQVTQTQSFTDRCNSRQRRREEGRKEGGSFSLSPSLCAFKHTFAAEVATCLAFCVCAWREGGEGGSSQGGRKELPLQEVAIINYLVAVDAMHAVKLHKNLHFLPRRVRAMLIGRGGMASVGRRPAAAMPMIINLTYRATLARHSSPPFPAHGYEKGMDADAPWRNMIC